MWDCSAHHSSHINIQAMENMAMAFLQAKGTHLPDVIKMPWRENWWIFELNTRPAILHMHQPHYVIHESSCVDMYVCKHVCVCVYVCMYACMYVCVYVCMYACMYVCMYSICIYACVCMHVCLYVCMCVYVCM